MTIELDSNDTLKVALNREDMKRLNITFEELDYDNEPTRRVLWTLLGDAGHLTGFSPKGGNLLIEVFPAPHDGCIIYFTKLQPQRQTLFSTSKLKLKNSASYREKKPYIFEFCNCDDLLSAVEYMYRLEDRNVENSSLFEYDNAYRLVIYPHKKSACARTQLCEFGRFVGDGDFCAAQTAEHWHLIADENVIETIGSHLVAAGR